MQIALAAIPDTQLYELGRVAGEVARLGYAWIVAAVEWEKRGRSGNDPGQFPEHDIVSGALGDAIGFLWAFAGRMRASPDGVNLWPIVAVLDAAVAQLTTCMQKGAGRVK